MRYYNNTYIFVSVLRRRFLLHRPVHRVWPVLSAQLRILQGSTGQTGQPSACLAPQRFPSPAGAAASRRCCELTRIRIFRSHSCHCDVSRNGTRASDYLLRAPIDVTRHDVIFQSAKISTCDVQDPIIMLPPAVDILLWSHCDLSYTSIADLHKFAICYDICM